MKKTIKININGLVFHIDEDAFERLENYLDRLKSKFRGTDGEAEIITDIESRIAEVFQTKISDEKEVIGLADVEAVVALLGEPEEIDGSDDEPEEFEPSSSHEPRYREARKRIYRDPDSRIVGGVCGGLGEYFRVDPLVFRILFIVFSLAYGVGFLIYLLLWAVVPEARTRSEKLEMKGEDINVHNIEKSIRKEYEQVKTKYNDYKESGEYHRQRNFFGRLVRGIGKIILIFFKVIIGIIGVSFVIAGVGILVAIIGSLVAGHTWFINDFWDVSGFSVPEILSVFMDETMAIIAVIAVFALVAIPVLGLIYAGVKMLFPFRANDKAIVLSSLGVWVGALVVLLIFGASEGMKHNTSARSSESREIMMDSVNQITLMSAGSDFDDMNHVNIGFGYHQDLLVAEKGNKLVLMGEPEIDIIKSFDDKIEIAVKKRARGVSDEAARRQAEEIQYSYHVRDSLIVFDPYFDLPEDVKWRDQELDIIISLPVGTVVFIDESMRDLLHGVENMENLWSDEMVGKTWIMSEEGLSRTDKETE